MLCWPFHVGESYQLKTLIKIAKTFIPTLLGKKSVKIK